MTLQHGASVIVEQDAWGFIERAPARLTTFIASDDQFQLHEEVLGADVLGATLEAEHVEREANVSDDPCLLTSFAQRGVFRSLAGLDVPFRENPNILRVLRGDKKHLRPNSPSPRNDGACLVDQ